MTAARLFPRELSMKKVILVGLAIFAVSTSAALAAKKQKPAAAPAAMAGPAPMIKPSAADMALYKKSQVESGMMKKKK